MSELVDHLAELTEFRDRDRLDVTLVGALRDLLSPLSVAMWGCVGEPGQERWIKRALLGAEDVAASSDSLWAEVDSLPELRAHPLRETCLVRQRFVTSPGPPIVSMFPLSAEVGAGGVLEIESMLPLGSDAQRLVHSVLRIYRNFQALLDYSERDTLTGLLNRKTFEESFLKVALGPAVSMLAESDPRRLKGPPQQVYVGVIDIDHFKSVNDRFGHLVGDEVLLLLSRLMRSTFRFSDRLYRFGGEEFVVMMRCANAEDAMRAFERLRANTQRYLFPQVGHITVSVGFTEVQASDTPNAAFQRADTAVYYAKEHGRDQVRSHASLIAEGAVRRDNSKSGDADPPHADLDPALTQGMRP